ETTRAGLTALRGVRAGFGLPMALYTDRAGWAFHTPTAGGRVDRTHLTVVGRILARLGIEHIPSYSPQARGRVERLNRTLQGRLVNELRVAGITTLDAANAYLRDLGHVAVQVAAPAMLLVEAEEREAEIVGRITHGGG